MAFGLIRFRTGRWVGGVGLMFLVQVLPHWCLQAIRLFSSGATSAADDVMPPRGLHVVSDLSGARGRRPGRSIGGPVGLSVLWLACRRCFYLFIFYTIGM